MKNGVPDYTDHPDAVIGFYQASLGQFAAEVLAEALLRTADDLIAGLNYPLRKPSSEQTNTKSGRMLSGGVAVDELLDAFGNAPRHRPEWARDAYKGKRNIITRARFYSGKEDLDLDEATSIVSDENEAALRIIDAIAPGCETFPFVDCDKLMNTLEETGQRIIDDYWCTAKSSTAKVYRS